MSLKVAILTSFVWLFGGMVFMVVTELGAIHSNNGSSIFFNSHDDTMTMKSKRTQPGWTYKYKFMEQPNEIPAEKKICFVHVGKTAGSTLACYLGFDYGQCITGENETSSLFYSTASSSIQFTNETAGLLQQMIPEGNLPHYTTSMIHRQYDSCLEAAPFHMYLFVVRNPFTRIQSWFEYERPQSVQHNNGDNYNNNRTHKVLNTTYFSKQQKPLFIECKYKTLNMLGGPTGLGAKNNTLCSRRAFRAIAGIVGYTAHNYYNYAYYYNKVITQHTANPRISVIRTEHLENDWSRLEQDLLDGPALSDEFHFTRKNKSPKLPGDLELSEEARTNICQVLCHEIQTYKKILQQAVNLNKHDYAESIQELRDSCPREARITNCYQ